MTQNWGGMMKVRELLELVDELVEGNPYSVRVKLSMVNQIEAHIQRDVMLLALDEIRQYSYTNELENDLDMELVVKPPYLDVYISWLKSRLYFELGEFEKNAECVQDFNMAYERMLRDWAEHARPGGGRAVIDGYYLSAYGLARQMGYAGTLQQWLASLKGGKGDGGDSAYKVAVKNGFQGTVQDWLQSLTGERGYNAYEIAVQNGFEGSVEEWLESLVGPKGDTGGVSTVNYQEPDADGDIHITEFTHAVAFQPEENENHALELRSFEIDGISKSVLVGVSQANKVFFVDNDADDAVNPDGLVKLVNLQAPTDQDGAATKDYVDRAIYDIVDAVNMVLDNVIGGDEL